MIITNANSVHSALIIYYAHDITLLALLYIHSTNKVSNEICMPHGRITNYIGVLFNSCRSRRIEHYVVKILASSRIQHVRYTTASGVILKRRHCFPLKNTVKTDPTHLRQTKSFIGLTN